MDPREVIKRYLRQQYMMQLATVRDGQPWCCTVYYVVDEAFNIYWASVPSRRHSQEIAEHAQVAVAIPVQFVNGEKVAGVQIAGTAEMLEPSENLRPIVEKYAATFHRTAEWVDDFTSGRTEHRLYKITPSEYVLFDEVNFPDDPRHSFAGLLG